MNNLSEIIKNLLFIVSLISGSLAIISLMIIGVVRLIGIMIDHLRIANAMKECLKIYVKQKRPDLKIKSEDIIRKE